MTISLSPFLYIGVTSASFTSFGTVPVITDIFIIWVKGSATILAPSFKNLGGNLSGPVLLLVFSFVNSRSVKLVDTVVSVNLFGRIPLCSNFGMLVYLWRTCLVALEDFEPVFLLLL